MKLVREDSHADQEILELAEALIDYVTWASSRAKGAFAKVPAPEPIVFFEATLQSNFGQVATYNGDTHRRYTFQAAGAKQSLYVEL